jgi:putative membrane protein
MTLHGLPTLNALLNATSAVLLLLGWRAIRAKRVPRHRALMIAALCSSVAFLTSYLIYHAQHGATRFPGTGAVRTVYLTILGTHTVLAAVQVPFIVTTVVLAARGRFARHRRWARVTLPIWVYVSVTGVVIYLMLYHMYPAPRAVAGGGS